MNWIGKVAAWKKDQVLGRVVRNSGWLFASNLISAVLSIVTANMLGVEQFGALGIIMALVSNVNRLLSFRMGDFIVRYLSDALAHQNKTQAAALVKLAGLTEAVTSLIAFWVLYLLAPLGARYFVHDEAATPLVLLYGVSILGMITTETATGVLQVSNRFRSQSVINLIQAVVTGIMLVYAAVSDSGIVFVTLAYLVGKLIAGLGPIFLALKTLRQTLGHHWWNASFKELPPVSELVRFGLSTNLSGTINMVVRDSELLWVGGLLNVQAAGYFKVALSLISLVTMPINPFISTMYPEISRAISLKSWKPLRKLLRRVTLIAAGWTVAAAIGLGLLGEWLLFTPWIPWKGGFSSIYTVEYLPSLPLILILLIGFGIANIFFWNRSLLLGFGSADFPLWVSMAGMIIKVILSCTLVPRYGYVVEAWLLSLYLAGTVLVIFARGWTQMKAAAKVIA